MQGHYRGGGVFMVAMQLAATNEQKGLRLASVRPSGARVVRPRVPLVVCFM